MLVALVLVLVLAGVAYGPVSGYLRRHDTARAVESARTLNTLLAQYATDNNGVYPVGEGTRAEGTSEGIALDLLQNSFTPNTDIFTVGSTTPYDGKGGDYADLKAENMSWDFTAGANANTGISSAAPDLLPVLYTTGETVSYPPPGKGLDLAISGKGPFGEKGVVVAYKGGNVVLIRASGAEGRNCLGFISADFKDTGAYTQLRP
jgi:type II secretory pathway pseudopilin PulG